MTLVDSLRQHVGPLAESFRLSGDDLTALTGSDLVEAANRYRAGLSHVPASLQDAFLREQRAHAEEATRWLHRYNRSLAARVRGYAALGSASSWAYPWPVVAILGLSEVQKGMTRMRAWGLLGGAAKRARVPAIEEIVDYTDDVLRRTNRGIFADSVPIVLYAMRVRSVRARGEPALADALLSGPLLPTMDEECRSIATELECLLGQPASPGRFHALAALTLRQFGREQAVFSHHLGPPDGKRLPGLLGRVTAVRSVGAPTIERQRGRLRLTLTPYVLPNGFDMRDHDARVTAFGAAYVQSVTRTEEDYAVARDWVIGRVSR